MTLRRSFVSLALGLSFAVVPALSQAQAPTQPQTRESAKRDVAVWADAVDSAFTAGSWQASMEAVEGSGKPQTESSTDCLEGNEMLSSFTALEDVFVSLIDNTDCTTQSGGKGSLALTLECQRGDGGRMRFVSTGTSTTTSVDWTVSITSEGPGAFEPSRMTIRAKKVADQC